MKKKTTQKNLMHEVRLDIPIDARRKLVALLNESLATLTDLYAATKHAHWSVKGANFYGLHLLFDEIAEEVEELVDEMAERITALGGTAFGTIQSTADATRLKPYPIDIFSQEHHLIALAEHIAAAAKILRGNIKLSEALQDYATGDLFIEACRLLDKRLWFIESHMQTTEKL